MVKPVCVENSTHYFGAGPAALPSTVKEQIQSDVIQYKDSSLSILELSHRSEEFAEILSRAENYLRELYAISLDYKILFMHSGATAQFDAIPLNLLGTANRMTYVNTGFWSHRAADFAKKYGNVQLIDGLSRDNGKICCLRSRQWKIENDSAYVHITPNETIDGIELTEIEEVAIPLVADATSCLLMRPFDINRFGLIYAATQKTMGISGLTVVIIRQDLLDRAADNTPWLYRYDVYAREKSIVNTSPVFACYVAERMLEWVCERGGIARMHADAKARSACLYEAIDKNSSLTNRVCASNRSCMNVVFDFKRKEKLKEFLHAAREQGLRGLKGHRLIGGIRASMYNGTPMPAVEKLAELMQQVV